MSDEFEEFVVEIVGETTDDEQEQMGNMIEASFRCMKFGGWNGVWLRADGRAEIVPHWVVSERKRRQNSTQ